MSIFLKLLNQIIFHCYCTTLMLDFLLKFLDCLAVFLDFPKKCMNLLLMPFVILFQCLGLAFQ